MTDKEKRDMARRTVTTCSVAGIGALGLFAYYTVLGATGVQLANIQTLLFLLSGCTLSWFVLMGFLIVRDHELGIPDSHDAEYTSYMRDLLGHYKVMIVLVAVGVPCALTFVISTFLYS